MCAGQSGLLNGKVCRTDGFLAGLGPSVPRCSHTLDFTLQMLAFYALQCWATRLLYLVAQWETTFQSNLASPAILASCMANLSKFHVVFSSSTLIRLDKDVFEGHLCQTVNNFVKQNKSSLLSPLKNRRPPL